MLIGDDVKSKHILSLHETLEKLDCLPFPLFWPQEKEQGMNLERWIHYFIFWNCYNCLSLRVYFLDFVLNLYEMML